MCYSVLDSSNFCIIMLYFYFINIITLLLLIHRTPAFLNNGPQSMRSPRASRDSTNIRLNVAVRANSGDVVDPRITRHVRCFSVSSIDEDDDDLVALSQADVRGAESELARSWKLRKSTQRNTTSRHAHGPSSTGIQPTRNSKNDDSLAFLLEMQKKLDAEDYKKIFENPRVRGYNKEL